MLIDFSIPLSGMACAIRKTAYYIQHFFIVGHASFCKANHAFFIYDVDGALNTLSVLFERIITGRDLSLAVARHRKIKAKFVPIAAVCLHRGRIHRDYLRACIFEFVPVVSQRRQLAVSPGCIVLRIEHEQDMFFTEEIFQAYRSAGIRIECEIRGFCPNL